MQTGRRRRDRRIQPGTLPDDSLTPAAARPDHYVLIDEAQQAQDAMQRLRPEERQVLDLAINHGLTQTEIAATTQMPLGTVKTHARRGLARLREMLNVAPVEQTEGGRS